MKKILTMSLISSLLFIVCCGGMSSSNEEIINVPEISFEYVVEGDGYFVYRGVDGLKHLEICENYKSLRFKTSDLNLIPSLYSINGEEGNLIFKIYINDELCSDNSMNKEETIWCNLDPNWR